MSLIDILEKFIDHIDLNKINNDVNEKSYICQLNYILDEYYQYKFEDENEYNDNDYSKMNVFEKKDDEKLLCDDNDENYDYIDDNYNNYLTKIDNILNELRNISDRDRVNNIIYLPKLYDLKLYNPEIIKRWVELDNMENIEYQMVFNACKQNYSDEYIIYLIESGFKPSIYDTLYIAENKHFELLEYYINNKLPYNEFTPNEIIRQGRLDILDWLFTKNMIKSNMYEYLIDSAIMFNDIFIMDYLKEYHDIFNLLDSNILCKSNSDKYNIYKRLHNEFINGKVNNVMLAWLWGNTIKWTKEDAIKFNIPFMLSFYQ